MRQVIRCWKGWREAREARIGLWVDPQPVPPWVYHKAKRVNDLNLSQLIPRTDKVKWGGPIFSFFW
jgi:hypothetical protein